MERLQKIIAQAGIASRRKAEVLITEGRVTVNGEVVRDLGTKASTKDKIEVDGSPIYKEEPVYFLFHKPSGVISSVSDEKGRRTVLDYFQGVHQRIFPVGRLDWDTTGLLILTNDGEFSNLLTHPKHEIDKVYVAKLKGLANKENLRPLTRGMVLEGKKVKPARYEILRVDEKTNSSTVALTIHEGRNHQVKNMFEAVGLPVQKLKREQFGSLTLENVPQGTFRALTPKEIKQLIQQAK